MCVLIFICKSNKKSIFNQILSPPTPIAAAIAIHNDFSFINNNNDKEKYRPTKIYFLLDSLL